MDPNQADIIEEIVEKKEEKRTYFRGVLAVVVINIVIIGGSYYFLSSKNRAKEAQLAANVANPASWTPAAPVKAKNVSAYKTPETWGENSEDFNQTDSTKYAFVSKDTLQSVKADTSVLGTDEYSPVGLISVLKNESDLSLESYDNLYKKKPDYDGVIIDLKQIYDVAYRCLQRKDGEKVQISCVAKRNNKDTIYRLNTTTTRKTDAFKSLTGIIEGTDSIGS